MITDKHDPIHDCDCQACALAERDKLRARVLELEAVHEDASGAVLQERERWRVLLEARAAGCERAAENYEDPKFDAMARILMSVREQGSRA
jgi:hypothetical protein